MTQSRWVTLMGHLGLPESLSCFNQLQTAYSEPHRHYHNKQHIEAMLHHFDTVSHHFQHPNEAELAIWFHDAIYKPFSSNNELNSARWAQDFLQAHNYPKEATQRVYSLIMATLHNGQVQRTDEQLLVDIDLSILGQPANVYQQFEKNVRKEYRFIPSFIFKKNRRALLEGMLGRENIYHTEYFRDLFEDVARDNIEQAIQNLT